MTFSRTNHICVDPRGDTTLRHIKMLMNVPTAFLDSQFLDARAIDRQAPAPEQPAALWFTIGLILSTLLAYASVRYGIASPDVMG
jgi:hypothetical protein